MIMGRFTVFQPSVSGHLAKLPGDALPFFNPRCLDRVGDGTPYDPAGSDSATGLKNGKASPIKCAKGFDPVG
jgi:hypothetical protein